MSSSLEPGTGVGGSDGNDNTGSKPPVRKMGRVPTDIPEFYEEWGKENAKSIITQINGSLSQILTIGVSLFAGSIAFWNYMPVSIKYRFLIVLILLINVIVALFCSFPIAGVFDLKDAEDIKRHMEDLVSRKRRRLLIAQFTFVAALVFALFGLAFFTLTYKDACYSFLTSNILLIMHERYDHSIQLPASPPTPN